MKQRLPDEILGMIFSHLPLLQLKALERCSDFFYWSLIPAAMYSRLLRLRATLQLKTVSKQTISLTLKRRLPSSISFGGGVEFIASLDLTKESFRKLFPLTLLLTPSVDFKESPLPISSTASYPLQTMANMIFHESYRYVDQVIYFLDSMDDAVGDGHVILRLNEGKLSVFLSWARVLAQGHPSGICAGPALGRPLPPGHDPGQSASISYRLGETDTLPMHPNHGKRYTMEQRLIKDGVDPSALWKYSIVRRWIVAADNADQFEDMATRVILNEQKWGMLR